MAIVIGSSIFTGGNLVIGNNRIIIDGVDITDNLPDQKEYIINIDADVKSVQCGACKQFTVNGSVGSVTTQSGDVNCGNVGGSVSTMSGDVDCGNISGNVSTMSGNIKHKKI